MPGERPYRDVTYIDQVGVPIPDLVDKVAS
jgi:hypothetical protein